MAQNSGLPRFPKVDQRLLGTWKSDKTRTLKEWIWEKNASRDKKKRFGTFFGKLEIVYTRTRIISTLRHKDWQTAKRYVVAAADDTSVAVVTYGKLQIKNRIKYDPENLRTAEQILGSGPKISQLHFDKNHYWVALGNGRNREFFKKISR